MDYPESSSNSSSDEAVFEVYRPTAEDLQSDLSLAELMDRARKRKKGSLETVKLKVVGKVTPEDLDSGLTIGELVGQKLEQKKTKK